MKGKLNFFIPFGIAIVSIPTVEQWSNLPIGNLVFWWIIDFFSYSFYCYQYVAPSTILAFLGFSVLLGLTQCRL